MSDCLPSRVRGQGAAGFVQVQVIGVRAEGVAGNSLSEPGRGRPGVLWAATGGAAPGRLGVRRCQQARCGCVEEASNSTHMGSPWWAADDFEVDLYAARCPGAARPARDAAFHDREGPVRPIGGMVVDDLIVRGLAACLLRARVWGFPG